MPDRKRRPRALKNHPYIVLIILIFLTAGCSSLPPQREIGDLQRLPQSPIAYLDEQKSRQPSIPDSCQKILAADFLEKFFLPWHGEGPLPTTDKPSWAIAWVNEHTVFGENLRPVAANRVQELIRRADFKKYPSLDQRAITVHRCDLRALPSRRPFFNDPRKAGQGFPFDQLQHAALPANTPLKITHQSPDGAWVFVETSLAYGWAPATDIAWVDDAFVQAFETGRYLAVSRDGTAVSDTEGNFLSRLPIGSLLPLADTGDDGHHVLAAVAASGRTAHLIQARIPGDTGDVFPLPLTPLHLATLAERMMGQPYGWGESFGNRDCSATIRDLFAPFGIWLPRNSARQAREGKIIPLADLAPAEREQRLLAEGIPFLTLVRIPGHIMLYLGEFEERAAVLHTLWGVRTKNFWGREGRWLVGQTVITGLQPGMEQNSPFTRIGDLRTRVESMNLLPPCERHPARK
ncbi:MAG: glycoside hydrolase [Desulfuromonadaceae bacterium]|nr:glycoside hydrolase [Desulfuromonadaceae bacterium]